MIKFLASLSAFGALTAHAGPVDSVNQRPILRSSCSATGPESCLATTAQLDSCCFESPAGLLLQTQFWDTAPAIGPPDLWTIHGLWNDYCDAKTWPENCDPTRFYPNITEVLLANGKADLLDYMNKVWLPNKPTNEDFWSHEWDKHGTCMSTLNSRCMPSGSPAGADAAAYFQRTVDMFNGLPTYAWLAAEGIKPSDGTVSYADLASAIKKNWGFTPALDCRDDVLKQIAYYYHIKGSLLDGTLVPLDAPKQGSCPLEGIKYRPKVAAGPGPGPGPGPALIKGTINAITSSGESKGCLLSAGKWSTQTCATFRLSSAGPLFTLKSSKGLCEFAVGAGLNCGDDVTVGAEFSLIEVDGKSLLAYDDSTEFTADSVPSGIRQVPVFHGRGSTVELTLNFKRT